MTTIRLSALAANGELNIKTVRTDDQGNDVKLIIEAGDTQIEISLGSTIEDADNLAGQLTEAASQASAVSEQWANEPSGHDLWVTLDRDRYYVTWDRREQPGQPGKGYPSRGIALYEAARWMAESGEFPAAWITGEHGPATENIDERIRAFHDAGDVKLLPLPSVRYQPGDEVRLSTDQVWVVHRDYGTDLGVWVYISGDPDIDMVARHDQLTLVPAEIGEE